MASTADLRINTTVPPARRRSDGNGDRRAARDRLVSMLLLAALLHGLVILGVTFGPFEDKLGSARGLEVLLVSDELPEARRNDSATYLSQRTQTGSGNTQERKAARVPGTAPPGGGPSATPAPQSAEQAEEDELLTTTAPRARVSFTAMPLKEALALRDVELPLLLGDGDAPPQPQSLDADSDLALRGAKRDELYVTADTRASELAPYLDGWRRRVERIGTLNYPSVAQRRSLTGNPVIEVTISRDGRLQSAVIRQSSGHPEIDAAALDILKLASPFEPFPLALANRYRVLHFAYEWQFVGGRLGGRGVSIP
jgi:protein TonB